MQTFSVRRVVSVVDRTWENIYPTFSSSLGSTLLLIEKATHDPLYLWDIRRGGDFEATAATLPQPQPPSTPLDEPRFAFPVARARVSPSPRREGDDGSLPSISILIGWTTSSGTDSAPPCRWPLGPAHQRFESRLSCALAPDWAGPAQIWPGPFRSGPHHVFLDNALLICLFCKLWNSIEFVLCMQMRWFKFPWVA
jgi:hypothetical protein